MLLILLSTFLLCIVFLGYASLTKKMFNSNDLLSFQLLKGIFIVALCSTFSSIFTSLNFIYELIIIGLGVGLFLYHKQWNYFLRIKTFPKSFYVFIGILLLVTSMNAFIYDTFSYYLPTIKWLDDYGLVKGLANFDFNLGQTSVWHILSATFNQTIDFYYKINLVIAFVYLLYIYEIKKYTLLLLIPTFFFFIASPSPDLPVIILSIIAIINYIKNKSEESIVFGMMIGGMLVLIKPIAFVLAIFFFILWVIEVKQKNKKEVIFLGIIISLFVIKNIILTANIMFPLAYGNLTNLVHAIPQKIYDLSALDGRYLATSRVDEVDYEEFKNWSTIQYFRYIFTHIHLSIFLYFTIAFVNLIFMVHTILKKDKIQIILASLLFLKVIVFFFISIQYRFILDNLVIILSLYFYQYSIKPSWLTIPSFCASILIVFSVSFISSNSLPYFMRGIAKYRAINTIKPKNYRLKFQKAKYSNFETNYNKSYFSADIKQPVLNKRLIGQYKYQEYYPKQLNKNSVKDGFILVKMKNKK